MLRAALLFAVSVLALVPPPARAGGTFWDEAIDGDLSNDRFMPNTFTLAPGIHSLRATSGQGDREFLTITIPAGAELAAIILTEYSTPDDVMFVSVVAGPIMTVDPDSPDPAGLLGWTYIGEPAVPVGEDILLPMSFGGQGFTPPLGPGQYAFWMQQLNGPTAFGLDFVVLPAPGAAAFGAIIAPWALRRRRA